MKSVDRWIADIQEAVEALSGDTVPDQVRPSTPAISRALAIQGFPGVLPLWIGRRYVVGLVATPDLIPQSWPGVILQDGQGLTLASDSRTLLPQLIVQRYLSNVPDITQKLSKSWTDIRRHMLNLHEALGGTEESLEAIATVLRDPASRGAFRYTEADHAAFEAAHSIVCRNIDSSETFTRYADWLDACIAGSWTAPGALSVYGAWGRRVICWAQRMAFAGAPIPRLPPELIVSIIEGNAGIDSAVPIEPSWSVQAGGASGETALVEAATMLEGGVAETDPVSAGLINALITEDASYRGGGHAEAVVALDERGESTRAWGILQSAAWWMARNMGAMPDAILEGARFMAARHKWSDVLWVLDRGIGMSETPGDK